MEHAIPFLTGNFPYSSELQSFWMAIQGAMIVRTGLNQSRKLNWFHAFAMSVMCGYAGATFGFLWLGKPSSMLSNDLNMASCIVAFVLVNYMPFDIGFKICNSVPGVLLTVSFAQLFRSLGIVKFADACFQVFKDSPSAYYPIPIFGPILYATMLGNMGGFFMKGFEGHVQNGMPWPIQNGLFCASFYHFYVHDQTGPIGTFLRGTILPHKNAALFAHLSDRDFACALVSLFMQIVGILQIPFLLGPSFSPFETLFVHPWKSLAVETTTTKTTTTTATSKTSSVPKAKPTANNATKTVNGNQGHDSESGVKRKKRKNKSAATKKTDNKQKIS